MEVRLDAGNVSPVHRLEITATTGVLLSSLLTIPPTAIGFFMTVETAPVRIGWENGQPTATTGHLLLVADAIRWDSRLALDKLRLCKVETTAPIVQITFIF